jgi:hypothetical protein
MNLIKIPKFCHANAFACLMKPAFILLCRLFWSEESRFRNIVKTELAASQFPLQSPKWKIVSVRNRIWDELDNSYQDVVQDAKGWNMIIQD